MKLKNVKISNILSFSFKDDFLTSTPDIIFDEKLNLIVGANGSGKSNFVEIIFTLFQSYFIESYNYNYAFDSDRDHAPTLIKRADSNNGLLLNKHNKFTTEQSKIYKAF